MTTWPRLWLPLCGALLIGMTPAAQAQDYPNRPINVIVPFPAGGLTDVPARIAATMMSEKIGQNLVVENKTGATGTIGAALCGACSAGRLHAVRQFAGRRAEYSLRAADLQSGR